MVGDVPTVVEKRSKEERFGRFRSVCGLRGNMGTCCSALQASTDSSTGTEEVIAGGKNVRFKPLNGSRHSEVDQADGHGLYRRFSPNCRFLFEIASNLLLWTGMMSRLMVQSFFICN